MTRLDAENVRLAEARFQHVMLGIERLNKDTSQDPLFTNVLVGLGIETYNNFSELKTGAQEHIMTRTALGTRNLFELKFWVQYAVASDENIRRIQQDGTIDIRELLDQHKASLEVGKRLNLDTEQQEDRHRQGRSFFEDKCQEYGIFPDGKHLQIANIARELGCEAEYKSIFSLVSKFVHPTGLSITMPRLTDDWFENFYSMGCWYFNEALVRLNVGLRDKGFPALL